MKTLLIKLVSVFFLFNMIFFPFTSFAEGKEADNIWAVATRIINYEKTSNNISKSNHLFTADYLKNAEDLTSLRFLTAMSRLGYPDSYDNYNAILSDIVKKKYASSDKLSSVKAYPWHNMSLGLMASGSNPQNIPFKDGNINLVKDGVWGREKAKPLEKDGLESLISGLLILDGYNTIIPPNETVTYSREQLIKKIMSFQTEDGSFHCISLNTVPEITAMAICALAPYREMTEEFSFTSIDTSKTKSMTVGYSLSKALTYLSQSKSVTGDYSSFEKSNIRIMSKTVVALCSLGINPKEDERFITDGNNLIDLLIYEQNPDGSVSENQDNDKKREDSSFALEAFSAYFRLINQRTPFYNFTDCNLDLKEKVNSDLNLKTVADLYIGKDAFISSDDYEELVLYVYKAENSVLTEEDKIYLPLLKEKINELYSTKQKIAFLNEQGKILSSSDTVVDGKNSHEINEFLKAYNALDENEKSKVTSYNSVVEKKNSFKSKTAAVYVLFALIGLVAIFLIAFLAVFLVRSTPVWDYLYMKFSKNPNFIDEYDDDEEDELEYYPYPQQNEIYYGEPDEEDDNEELLSNDYVGESEEELLSDDYDDYVGESELPFEKNEEFFDYEYKEEGFKFF